MSIRTVAVTAGWLLVTVSAQAGPVTLDLGPSSEDFVLYGLGPIGGSPPFGTYSIGQGACSSNGLLTICTLSGAFTSAISGLTSGTYSFVTQYNGNDSPDAGPNAPLGQSNGNDPIGDPTDANSFHYTFIDPSTSMILTLVTGGGTYVETLVTAGNFVSGTGFSFAYTGNVCSGTPVTPCSQYEIGITPGAIVQDPVTITAAFNFTPSIPEPATLALISVGLAGLGFARLRKLT